MPETTIPPTSSVRNIRYLTIQGGGMKGIGYVGAVEELVANGVLPQIEEVAGSSAGGLMATLIAIGCTPEEIREEMVGIDFRSFQDKKEPGIFEAAITKKGHIIDDLVNLAFNSGLGQFEGDTLLYWLSSIIARKTGNPNITFKELSELTNLPGSSFKKLILTGSNLTKEGIEYYSAATTPDIPIVTAARISASFPFAYKPLTKQGSSDTEEVLVDGGLLENLPDVFNKQPYISVDGVNNHGANPKVFALSFKNPDAQKPKKIKEIFGLAKAIYDTKMSENELQKKYDTKIALVDTVGMGTLEFDAPQEKRDKLADSGKIAVAEAIANILEQEQQLVPDYKSMPIIELVRREFALHTMMQDTKSDQLEQEMVTLAKEMQNRVNNGETSEEQLNSLRKEEYNRWHKIATQSNLNDQELAIICGNKISEFQRMQHELSEKINQLTVIVDAFKYEETQIMDHLEKDPEFQVELKFLREQEKKLEENIRAKVALNVNMEIAEDQKNEEHKLLDKQYEELKGSINKYLEDLIKKYTENPNEILQKFFANLLQDCNLIDFVMPHDQNTMHRYFDKSIQLHERNLDLAKQEFNDLNKLLVTFTEQQAAFAARKTTAADVTELVKFRNTLDQAIKSKTTLLVKLNNFITNKFPKSKKVVTPFLQAAAFVTFAAWLPIAAPIVGVAKTIEHFSKDQNTKNTAKRVRNYFSCSNLQLNTRLRSFREMTNKILKSNQASEYLPKLYEHYFNGTDLKLDDFIEKVKLTAENDQGKTMNTAEAAISTANIRESAQEANAEISRETALPISEGSVAPASQEVSASIHEGSVAQVSPKDEAPIPREPLVHSIIHPSTASSTNDPENNNAPASPPQDPQNFKKS